MNNAQDSNRQSEPTEPDLDAALEALRAVVMAQKDQIDALLASLERLLTSLNAPSPLQSAERSAATVFQGVTQASCFSPLSQPSQARAQRDLSDARTLGNPLDPQFTSLHQLMGRLKAA